MSETITPEGHVDEVGCWCGPTVHPVSGLGHTLAVTGPVDRPGGTDADLAKAAAVLGWSSADVHAVAMYDDHSRRLIQSVAAAFAAEREAALAPVIALAAELDAWRENSLRHARSCPPTSTDAAKSYARAAAYQRSIAAIRTTLTAPLAGQHTTDEQEQR